MNPLSKREIEVVQLAAQDLFNKEIADKLGLSIKTVERHRANAMAKLGIHSAARLIHWALSAGLVSNLFSNSEVVFRCPTCGQAISHQ